ncbi:flagellar basal body P-ring formation chaperone FlgA [Sneathiella limimaris]|uniref:flagellar basal body P-ring formation chaperone FlgA n=1 Tax=Sneathiella limimaris TaxID=1964213 RepID=UPI00146AE1F0|nr:flagellar basal body P-ring formation chaperone FlgA [Sneathiella limimaris]
MKHFTKLIAVLISMASFAYSAAAAQVTLKHNIVVEGESVTFGDVFHGAEGKSDYVIATAPLPGKSIVFNASSLAFVANKHGLKWLPQQSISQIVVHRQGQQIPEQQILQEIRNTLELEMGTSEFEVVMGRHTQRITVALTEDPLAAVETISYNRDKETFVAVLVAPANSDSPRRFRVSGNFYPQIMVPITSKLIVAGDEITEENIDYKPVRASKVKRNIALRIEDVIGKAPKRTIRTGGTISLNNLGEPVTISKGKLVSVTLKRGGLALSITGRALESGSTGDVIRVENIASRKPIQAEIISDQEVRIVTAQQLLAGIQ